MTKLGSIAAGLTLLITLGAREAAAQPTGYTRASGIGVNNSSVSTLANYQVRLVINTQTLIAAGQMRTDANDMVFTLANCGSPVLGHWIESGVNTASTVVWVKVPSLPSGVTRLAMWYSNAGAAATSAPRAVFIGAGASNDPISSTNQVIVTSIGTADNTQRGFRFSPNVPALVVDFGKREPTGTNKIVTLFNFTTQGIVRQVTVPGALGSYVYTPTAPFWLTAGQQYLLQIYGAPGESYYYGVSSQIAPDLTYYDLRYCNSCNQNTFPLDILAGYHYGNPDLRYYKRLTNSPEPTQTTVTSACVQTATCDPDCTGVSCGDGFLNATAGEACDDGNTVNTDICVSCQTARCGDGHARAGVEQCDDGNMVDTDTCRNNCTTNTGMGGAGGMSGSGGISGSGGAIGGRAGTSTGGNAGADDGGVGGEGGSGDEGGEAGASTGGTSTGGRGGTSTGGRGGTSTGGRGGTTAGGEGGEGNAGPSDGSFDRDKGCGCSTPGSRSSGKTAAALALLGLAWAVNARRRRSRRAAD
jgi:MYXO-CTERM domain-containing protein